MTKEEWRQTWYRVWKKTDVKPYLRFKETDAIVRLLQILLNNEK